MDERLEIIKDKQLQMHALSTFDINWLIQQAEKVQELELDRNDWKDEAGKWNRRYHTSEESHLETMEFLDSTSNQYKRLKEALEFYADIKKWTESTIINHFNAPDDPVLTKEPPAAIEDSGEKARQTLRGES